MRRWVRGLLIGVLTGVLGATLAFTPVGTGFEKNIGLPWLFKVRGPIEAPPDVAVVAIDSSTGTALDLPKLPRDWPRTVHGQLIDSLVKRGAAVIVFDMDFSRAKEGDEDHAFARAIAEANRVVLFERLVGKRQPILRADGSTGGWVWAEEALAPAAPLAVAAKATGPFPLPKLGQSASLFWAFKSSARDAPTTAAIAVQLLGLGAYDEWLGVLKQAGASGLEGLPVRADEVGNASDVRTVMEAFRAAFKTDPGLGERIERILGQDGYAADASDKRRFIAALAALYGGGDNRVLNLYGPPGTITTIPYSALFTQDGRESGQPALDLTGKVVFVGYSDLYEPDQPDRFYTVFTGSDGIDLSGVEIMATAFANLLTDRALRPSDSLASASIALAFGFTVGAGVYLLPAMVAVPLAFAVAGLYAAGVQWAFNTADLWLPLATPVLLQLPFALLLGLMGQYLLGRRRERQMSRAISYYLPENIVRDLTEGNIDPESVNRVVYGTCLATDMAGFSTIAETMSPKELAAFMNAYFDALARTLKRYAVDVTEFHADTIMCAWTAATPNPAVRRYAALAAIDVIAAIEEFAKGYGSLRLNPRIGLQDGNFYLGHTGGGGRFSYSILGDTANTAARLESLNKHLGTHLLAARSVVEGVDELLVRPLGLFRLVGRADATPVVEVLGRKETAGPEQLELCARFAQALAALHAQRWIEAAKLFEALAASYPDDGPSRFYRTRAERLAATDPEDGDDPTVIRMDAK